MKTPKIFIGALVFYCIAVFDIGITNAADATSGNSDMFSAQDSGFSDSKLSHVMIQQPSFTGSGHGELVGMTYR
jgi:hypothetical protein